MGIVLTREDTGDQLPLPGMMMVPVQRGGTLSTDTLDDRSRVNDNYRDRGATVPASGVVADRYQPEVPGARSIQETLAWLELVRGRHVVSLLDDIQGEVTDLVVVGYTATTSSDSSTSIRLSVDLQSAQFAYTERIAIADVPDGQGAGAAPRDAAADVAAPPVDGGPRGFFSVISDQVGAVGDAFSDGVVGSGI